MSVVPLISPSCLQAATAPRSFAAASFAGIQKVGGWVAREIRVRRDMRRLAEFDEHMLRDIGIGRSEIEGAVRYGRDGS